MKYLVLTALLVSGLAASFPNNASAQEVVIASNKDAKKGPVHAEEKVGLGIIGFNISKAQKDTLLNPKPAGGRFVGGITLTRFDLGFSKLIDNGSFSLSPENDFLDYKAAKTSTFSFDVLQMGYRFNQNFKIYLAGGFDWTHIRLKNNITMKRSNQVLDYDTEAIEFSKNRFSSFYIHVPLNFELRSKENDNGNRFYFVFGPELAFLTNAKVKQVSKENGKEKFNDDYNFQPLRYGGTVRIGWGSLGIFTKYYFTDMFDSAPQKGLKNMSFGVTLGLN